MSNGVPAPAPGPTGDTPAPCPVCGEAAARAFCPACGAERARSRRLAIGPLLRDGVLQFLSLEGPGLGTIAGMATRPGQTVRAYLAGERRRLLNPLKFAFVAGALLVLAFAIVRKPEEMPDADALDAVSMLHIINFIGIPVFGLVAWAVLRSARLTMAEHIAAAYFIYGEAMLCQAALVLAQLHRSSLAANVFGFVMTGYIIWAACRAWRVRWWKGVLVSLLAIVITTLLANVLLAGVVRAHGWWVGRA